MRQRGRETGLVYDGTNRVAMREKHFSDISTMNGYRETTTHDWLARASVHGLTPGEKHGLSPHPRRRLGFEEHPAGHSSLACGTVSRRYQDGLGTSRKENGRPQNISWSALNYCAAPWTRRVSRYEEPRRDGRTRPCIDRVSTRNS
jgi:hypothetical protein